LTARKPIQLTVNADDFNLTEGVARGIWEAASCGIVNSTSVMINLPLSSGWLRRLRSRRLLETGLHWNLSLGKPVSPYRRAASLTGEYGYFRRGPDVAGFSRAEIFEELEAQVERFRKLFGRLPSHFDFHHHLHEDRRIFEIAVQCSLAARRPLRISRHMTPRIRNLYRQNKIPLTGRLWTDLSARHAWSSRSLLRALRQMRPGFHEIMCHPGYVDRDLRKISSFAELRERELSAFCDKEVLKEIRRRKIRLCGYGV